MQDSTGRERPGNDSAWSHPDVAAVQVTEFLPGMKPTLKDARQQLQRLEETAERSMRSNPAHSAELASQALGLAESLGDRWHIANALFLLVRSRLLLGERSEDVVMYLRKAELLFTRVKDKTMRARVWLTQASYHHDQKETMKAGALFEKCIGEFERLNDRKYLGRALKSMMALHKTLGQYSLGLTLGLRAVDILEQEEPGQELSQELGGCLYEIGLLYKRIDDGENALRYLERSLGLRRLHGDRVGEAMTLHGIGSVYVDRHRFDEAVDMFAKARTLYHDLHCYDRESTAINSIGTIYDRMGQQKIALGYYKQAASLAEQYKGYRFLGRIYFNISRVHRMMENYPSAIVYIRKAKKIAEQTGDKELGYMLDHERSNMYEERQDYKRALHYYVRYTKVKEMLIGEERQRLIYEIQTRHEVERLERDKQIEALKAARLQQEMDHKNRELAMLAIQLAQKNQLLAKLTEEIQALKKEREPRLASAVERIEEYLQVSDGWEAFSKQFNLVHPGFSRMLARRFPEMTPTETRICCLLRVNLSSKDIANMLYIAVRTVEIHRGHIRKKLKIGNGVSLSTYIAGL